MRSLRMPLAEGRVRKNLERSSACNPVVRRWGALSNRFHSIGDRREKSPVSLTATMDPSPIFRCQQGSFSYCSSATPIGRELAVSPSMSAIDRLLDFDESLYLLTAGP